MAVTLPSLVRVADPFENVTDILRRKGHWWVTIGSAETADIPTDTTELTTLTDYTDAGIYLPLGKMNADVGTFNWTQETIETDFTNIPLDFTVEVTMPNITIDVEILEWLDDAEGQGTVSIMYVPDMSTVDRVIVFVGGTLSSSVEGNFDGKSVITMPLKFTAKSGAITNIVKLSVFS